MSFKDSNVRWLGAIPQNWEVKRLKHVSNILISNVDKHTLDEQQKVYLCNYTDVYKNEHITNELDFMFSSASDEQIEKLTLTFGDVIITKDSETPDDIGIPAFVTQNLPNVVCGYHLALLKPDRNELLGEFLHRYLQGAFTKAYFYEEATGITRYGLGKQSIADIPILIPPLAEQQAIAEMLDRETARLDELITEKERLVELLTEKRHALITNAVTRGLDADAPLVDSGIEWLGKIPQRWKKIRLKFLCQIFYGLSQPPEYHSTGTPFVRATNVERGKLNRAGLAFVDINDLDKDRIIELKVGDIIVVRSGAYTGDSALVTKEWENTIAGFDMVIRLNRKALPKFISQVLLSKYALDAQIEPLRSRAAQPHLNSEELGSVVVFLPSLEEQQEIVEYIEAETAKIDRLQAATRETIELLKERRSSLIAAAVTGKISVAEI